jgi:hypothetical protein
LLELHHGHLDFSRDILFLVTAVENVFIEGLCWVSGDGHLVEDHSNVTFALFYLLPDLAAVRLKLLFGQELKYFYSRVGIHNGVLG